MVTQPGNDLVTVWWRTYLPEDCAQSTLQIFVQETDNSVLQNHAELRLLLLLSVLFNLTKPKRHKSLEVFKARVALSNLV